MRPKVVGVTTEKASIAKMLGVESETDYGLYQETNMGKYYARILPNGTFEEKVVRLISYEQAAKLEASTVAFIKEACKGIQEIIASAPVIDMGRVNGEMETIRLQSRERAEEAKNQIKSSLERAGFHPTYSSN